MLAFLRHRYPPGHDAGIDAAFGGDEDGRAGLLALLQGIAALPGGQGQSVARLVTDAQRCIRSCERTVMRHRGLQADAVL